MNKTILYQIEFFSYWHSGSGLAGSTYADNVVNKTERNLPFIPGKTLKGLLRDAAEEINKLNLNLVSDEFIKEIFGKRENANYKDEGKAFFTNALLSEQLSEQIAQSENQLSNSLYTVLSSTRIDARGQAKDGSLRQLEVTIPLVLYGTIEHFPEQYSNQMEYCMKWIKEMGQNRNRGLGRCQFSILKLIDNEEI